MIHVLLNTNSRSLEFIYSVDVKRTNNFTLNKMKNKKYHSVSKKKKIGKPYKQMQNKYP